MDGWMNVEAGLEKIAGSGKQTEEEVAADSHRCIWQVKRKGQAGRIRKGNRVEVWGMVDIERTRWELVGQRGCSEEGVPHSSAFCPFFCSYKQRMCQPWQLVPVQIIHATRQGGQKGEPFGAFPIDTAIFLKTLSLP